MQTFKDFVEWAGNQRKAALHLGCSPSTVSRLCQGSQRMTPEIAERCEAVSHGLFQKERILWPDSRAA